METEKFVEYEAVSARSPLRQGDILERTGDIDDDYCWEQYLMVLTADCDLAQGKHDQRITCIPILAKDYYIHRFRLESLKTRVIAKQLAELRDVLTRNKLPTIGDERIVEWATERSSNDIVHLLKVTAANDIETIRRSVDAIRILATPSDNLPSALSKLITAQATGVNPPSDKNVRSALADAIRSSFKSPPGDAHFLSAIGPGVDSGYFAYLRQIVQVADSDITTIGRHRSENYSRISRLQTRYIHAITQKFAMVFMSIGLPSEYEASREAHMNNLTETI
ncbi:hypothetical protein [Tsukamurella pulmonis]|uniref:hypothetical protein n=1 Tax=Tsukamurella pulmonis TaxID=47312 RepID=UPI001059193E|nr:hypothetical protein [Tsukamurella pulmonis]